MRREITEGDTKNAPKYNSQELDKESGYYFYNARHYDPEIGRFVTADTVIDGELSTQGWNRFSYVHNNPIRYKDPTGHFGEDIFTTEYGLDRNRSGQNNNTSNNNQQNSKIPNLSMTPAQINQESRALNQLTPGGELSKKLNKAIPKINQNKGLSADAMASQACYSASLYTMLKASGANVESKFEDFYANQVNKGNIRGSDAYVKDATKVVSGYKIDGRKIKYNETSSYEEFKKSESKIGVIQMKTPGHFVNAYQDNQGVRRIADTGWSTNTGKKATDHVPESNFKRYITIEFDDKKK